MADAEYAGLTEIMEITDNESDAPGTILEDRSNEFRERFRAADLVIAKGQANYETLSHVDKRGTPLSASGEISCVGAGSRRQHRRGRSA
jgi:uncharacterized protein with ATP-grasp and redox domains